MPFTEKTVRFLLYKKANAEFTNYSEKRGRGLEDVHVSILVFETLQPRVHEWNLLSQRSVLDHTYHSELNKWKNSQGEAKPPVRSSVFEHETLPD